MAPTKTGSRHNNPLLKPGIHRFGRSKMYHKKGIFVKRTLVTPKKETSEAKRHVIEKPISGEKNGGKRFVQPDKFKSKRYHPTGSRRVHRVVKRTGIVHRIKLRSSLKPGTVLILLAGRHAGKRVVLLKQLPSGLLLVTGPFKLNGVPLRRINQMYVIATSTRLDISSVNIPDCLNDEYFHRDKKTKLKERAQQKGEIFATSKTGFVLSDQRKLDQVQVDKQVMTVIKGNDEKKMLLRYMSSSFSLKSGQYPHKMKF